MGSANALLIYNRDPATGRLTQRAGKAGCISQDSTEGQCDTSRLLGGVAFELLGMVGAYGLSAIIQLSCAVAILGFAYAQETRPLALGRIFTDIAAGLSFARPNAVILLVYAITIIVNATSCRHY